MPGLGPAVKHRREDLLATVPHEAAAVAGTELLQTAPEVELIGIELNEHIANMIEALKGNAAELGLAGES